MKKNLLLRGGMVVLFGLGLSMSVEAAPVAKLVQPEGKVLINKGKGYLNAEAGMPLDRGDVVLTLENSSVRVVYQDNCTVRVGPNSLYTLKAQDQCSKAAYKMGLSKTTVAEAVVPAEATDSVRAAESAWGIPSEAPVAAAPPPVAATPPEGGITIEALSVGAIAAGAIAAGIIISQGGGGGNGNVAIISPE